MTLISLHFPLTLKYKKNVLRRKAPEEKLHPTEKMPQQFGDTDTKCSELYPKPPKRFIFADRIAENRFGSRTKNRGGMLVSALEADAGILSKTRDGENK